MSDMKRELPTKSVPAGKGEDAAVLLKLPPDLLAAMDTYAADATGHPDRSALLLRIIRDWLVTNGYLRSDPIGGPDGGIL